MFHLTDYIRRMNFKQVSHCVKNICVELTLLHHTTLLLLEDNRYKIIIGGAVTIRIKCLNTLSQKDNNVIRQAIKKQKVLHLGHLQIGGRGLTRKGGCPN